MIDKLQQRISGEAVEVSSPLLPSLASPVCDISLILTDCSMPFVDGYQFAEMAHELFAIMGITEAPKIVAITGHVEPEYKFKAFLSGMDQVYSKPLSFDTLGYVLLEQGFGIEVPGVMSRELKAKAKDLKI